MGPKEAQGPRGPALILGSGDEVSSSEPKDEGWSDRYGLFLPDMRTTYPPHELPLSRALRGESTTDIDVFVRDEHAPDGLFATGSYVVGRPT